MRSVVRTLLVVLIVSAGSASLAEAQDSRWQDLSISLSRVDYDLSGTGNAPAVSVRATRNLTGNLDLQLGGSFAKPEQQFGPSTLFMPEAMLLYRWNLGRVSPYAGGGIGGAMVVSDFHTDWDPTLAVAGGAGIRLTDRVGLNVELRIRGHEWRFAGSTAEIGAGIVWRLPSF